MPIIPPKAPPFLLLPRRLFNTSTPHSLPAHTRASNLIREGLNNSLIPPYPYGPSLIYKQSNLGLYGLQKIRFGNKVSIKNEIKTRRAWRPNVHVKALYSECLDRMVRVRVTTRTLRTIDKNGGLDGYLLGGKTRRVRELGEMGWRLRWRVMVSEGGRERAAREGLKLRDRSNRLGRGMESLLGASSSRDVLF